LERLLSGRWKYVGSITISLSVTLGFYKCRFGFVAALSRRRISGFHKFNHPVSVNEAANDLLLFIVTVDQ